MNHKTYFEETKGMGVLSTADGEGRVNAAVYARPHVMDDGSLAFVMRDRLSHNNLQSNPRAAYLFREEGPGYKGIRLHLTKTHEESGT
ncbi:pyridoxamine 5'-phosphate oxidase family protein, partial [Desulfosarcina sp.]|uniref:pyridoxamine 5'-phosphate oxidase family protein n=1 Tax=Desulfosarcina sp. TaxID=2027861 RepID=UPI0029A561F5